MFYTKRRTILLLMFVSALTAHASERVYFNAFSAPAGTRFAEWSSSPISWFIKASPARSGALPPPPVGVAVAPGGRHFLGEFGGPAIGHAGESGWNRTRVDQTVTLSLSHLPSHDHATVSFDLLVLKSWDGNSPVFGPDRWRLGVRDGALLLDTTFSNNPKVAMEGSDQDYPTSNRPPRTGAISVDTLGYRFFGDSIYHFAFTFRHTDDRLILDFFSSLFEGKGTDDESWGLANVEVSLAHN